MIDLQIVKREHKGLLASTSELQIGKKLFTLEFNLNLEQL